MSPVRRDPDWAPDIDPRVGRARQLLAEHHQPLTMAPGELRRLLARFQQVAQELTDVIDEAPFGIIVPPQVESEKGRAKALLLAELPFMVEPGDGDDAAADILSDRDDAMCAVVTRWLRSARRAGVTR